MKLTLFEVYQFSVLRLPERVKSSLHAFHLNQVNNFVNNFIRKRAEVGSPKDSSTGVLRKHGVKKLHEIPEMDLLFRLRTTQ